jgi:hypothetical protein
MSDEVDRIDVIAAAVDGAAIELSAARAQGAVSDGTRAARVEWPVPESRGSSTVFEVRYRAAGVVGVEAGRGRLRWPVLTANRGFPVGRARLTLTVRPPGQLLRGSGISEADWTVEYVPAGITASKAGVGQASATVQADVSIDPRSITRPAWQVDADLRSQFSLAFVAGALFVLVIGVGVIWIVWLQHPRVRVSLREGDRPSLTIPPAAASVLAGRRVSAPSFPSEAGPASAAGESGPSPSTKETWNHQRLLDSGAATRNALRSTIVDDLRQHGLVDGERLRVREGFRTTALVGGALALACAGAAQLLLGRFGWWAQLIPASMLFVAIWFLLAARIFNVRTPLGEQEARLIRRTSKASRRR